MRRKARAGPALILAAGALIQLLTGFPSAWGAFKNPVMQSFQLDSASAGYAANSLVAAYGLGCVLGGLLQDRWGPKTAGICGSLLLCGGLAAVGFVPGERPMLFYLAFSLPVGAGCAFLYPAVMSCVQKWYGQRKGMATGVVGLGVGLSGLVLTLAVKLIGGRWGMRICFWTFAAVLGPLCLGCSFLLKAPNQKAAASRQQGMKPGQMLKTRQFYLAFLSMAFAAPALLLFSPGIIELAQKHGLSSAWAEGLVIVGTLGAAAGRLLAPLAGDRWNRVKINCLRFLFLAGLSVGLRFAGGFFFGMVYLLLCFCYAGQLANMPALCTQLFGLAHTGVNYGFLALGASLGSLAFPVASKQLGLADGRHWLAAVSALAGLLCLRRLELPRQENKK